MVHTVSCYCVLKDWAGTYEVPEGEARAPEKVGEYTLQTHDPVFVDIAKASMDVSFKDICGLHSLISLQSDAFPSPQSINPSRTPKERYLVGDGAMKCLGLEVSSRVCFHHPVKFVID